MDLPAGGDFQAMFYESEDGGKTFFGPALAAGQIDDEHASLQAGHAPRKPCKGVEFRASSFAWLPPIPELRGR